MARRSIAQLNALIAVNKPAGMTSHDVVARVRRAVGERRVGHAGTLDPMATGVMVVGIGQATRLLGMLTLDTKSYVAQVRFGAETTTDDLEGEVSREAPVPPDAFDLEAAQKALDGFLGEQLQVPPAYSAISVNGVRSYKRARSGESFELEARPVIVHAAQLLHIESIDGVPVWTVAFTVSKGTYIRALARDLGRSLGSAAHLTGLMRTASGSIRLDQCLDLAALTASSAHETALDPCSVLGVDACEVSEEQVPDLLCGKRIMLTGAHPEGREALPEGSRVALTHAGTLRALATIQGAYAVPSDVFPQPIEGVRS